MSPSANAQDETIVRKQKEIRDKRKVILLIAYYLSLTNMKDNNITFTEGLPLITKVFWIASLVVLIVIAAAAYVQSEKAINTMAVTGCMQAARLETVTETDEAVTIPETYWYERCLMETGNK